MQMRLAPRLFLVFREDKMKARSALEETKTMTTEQKTQDLESIVARLENRINVLEAESAVRRLQYTYGYLIDKCMYDETVDLFAANGEVRFMGGIYKGKEGVRRLYVGRFRKN